MWKKKCLKNTIFILGTVILTLLLFFVMTSYNLASDNPIDNPSIFDPSDSEFELGEDIIIDKASIILGAVQIVGIILSVAVLGILGIKYMTGSLEEKAEYKKTMIPYLIGAIMLFAIPQLVKIIYNITNSTIN